MESPNTPAPNGASELDEPESDKAPWVLVAQFFVIPLVVVVLAVAVFLLFGWFSREQRSPAEHLQEVRAGSLNRRWQAAFELSKELARKPELAQDEALFTATLAAFEGARDDARIRRYLALALGHFARPESVRALSAALTDADEETQVYAALALGTLADPAAVEPLIIALRAEAPAVRKSAAFALGQIGNLGAIPALGGVVQDTRFDVALQAACSLAQLHSADALPFLRRAITPAVVEAASVATAMTPEQKSQARINALRALVLLGDQESLPALREMAKSDADLSVRDAALRAVEAIESAASTATPR